MNNGKKEYPINGFEIECISKYGRKIYCYIRNGRGVTTFVKNQLNRRFRKFNKKIAKDELD